MSDVLYFRITAKLQIHSDSKGCIEIKLVRICEFFMNVCLEAHVVLLLLLQFFQTLLCVINVSVILRKLFSMPVLPFCV